MRSALKKGWDPPQDSDITIAVFVRDLENLEASIQEFEHKTLTTRDDVNTTLTPDPNDTTKVPTTQIPSLF